jgi:hypothetical protein
VRQLQPQAALLRIRLKRFHRSTDQDEVRRALNSLPAQEIKLLPGQEIQVPLGGALL